METQVMGTLRITLVSSLSIALIIAAGGLSSVPAATVTFPVQAHGVISDSASGSVRLLVSFGDLDSLSGKKILYAKCCLNIDTSSCVDVLGQVEVMPLTSTWSAVGVSWASGWNSPGGDFSSTFARIVGCQQSQDGDTEILLTDLVQAWADGRIANHGIILIPDLACRDYELASKISYPGAGYGKLIVRAQDKL
jgi:hypothetical protein